MKPGDARNKRGDCAVTPPFNTFRIAEEQVGARPDSQRGSIGVLLIAPDLNSNQGPVEAPNLQIRSAPNVFDQRDELPVGRETYGEAGVFRAVAAVAPHRRSADDAIDPA